MIVTTPSFVSIASRYAMSTLLLAVAILLGLQGCVPLVIGGAATAVAVTEDRRSTRTFVDDETIESSALLKVKNRYSSQVHVNITSYNRQVLLTGEALSEEIRHGVEELVRSVGGVGRINNEMVVGPKASLTSIGNDTAITANLKSLILSDSRLQVNHIKVVTESGVAYLMGILKRSEADAASQIASTAKGVRRVVRLFEYID